MWASIITTKGINLLIVGPLTDSLILFLQTFKTPSLPNHKSLGPKFLDNVHHLCVM